MEAEYPNALSLAGLVSIVQDMAETITVLENRLTLIEAFLVGARDNPDPPDPQVASDKEEAMRQQMARESRLAYSELKQMPNGDCTIYRFKLKGNRWAKVAHNRVTDSVEGQPYIEDENGTRDEMTHDDAVALLRSIVTFIDDSMLEPMDKLAMSMNGDKS